MLVYLTRELVAIHNDIFEAASQHLLCVIMQGIGIEIR